MFFLIFQIFFASRFIYFLLTLDKCCNKHTLKKIARSITVLSDKLVDKYRSSFWRIAGFIDCRLSMKEKYFSSERENRVRETAKQDVPGARCFIVTVGYYTGEARSNGPLPLLLLVSWCGLEEYNAAKPPAIRLQSDIFTQLLVIGRSSRAKSS